MLKSLQNIGVKTINQKISIPQPIQSEIIRKTIHLSIALVPFLAEINKILALFLLTGGTLFYIIVEKLRQQGIAVIFFSQITTIASRERDQGRFVLGPVTLGVGAILALLMYPDPAAQIAIFALAFGDGFASLIGKIINGIKIPLTNGKTLAGSSACFVSVFFITLYIVKNPIYAAAVALVATVMEMLPTGDLDNILIPVGTGFFVSLTFNIF